jgi:predicted Kef-type K+ transport protein
MFTNLLIVVAAGVLAPLALGFFPRVRLPAIVLEIVLGIVIGPSGLGWVKPDAPVSILALIGLAFLLFLSGLEVDVDRLRGRIVKLAALGFAVSCVIAVLIGIVLRVGGFVKSPLFVAIVLVATSLGVVFPVLKDSRNIDSSLGELVIAAASIARVRLDHPAFAVLLGQELDRRSGEADPARHLRAGGGAGGSCDRQCGAVDEPLASAAAPSGHHRTDSRARGIHADDRVCGACRERWP